MPRARFIGKKIVRPQSEKQEAPKPARELIIDLFRGIAVVMMIVTHVIALTFDYTKSDRIVYYIGLVGGITSFTAFLLISGVSAYYSYLRHSEKEEFNARNAKVVWRSVRIMFLYFILVAVGAFVLGQMYLTKPSLSWVTRIFDSLTLKNLVPFTEFLPAFAFFGISLIFFKRFYKSLSKSLLLTVTVGTLSFFAGAVLQNIDLHSQRLNTFKSLFVGHVVNGVGIHSFPLFQYLIVFILGIYIGKYFLEHVSTSYRVSLILKLLVGALVLTIASVVIYKLTSLNLFYPLPDEGRFPASVGFIGLSLGISFLILSLLFLFVKFSPFGIAKLLNYIGVKAFNFFFLHILILFAFKYYFDNYHTITPASNIWGILIISFIVIFASTVISKLFDWLDKKFFSSQEFRQDSRHFIVNIVPNFIAIVSLIFLVFVIYTNWQLSTQSVQAANSNFTKQLILNSNSEGWWNDAFKTKRVITIQNNSGGDYYDGDWVSLVFNHKQALDSKNAFDLKGNDLSIVFDNGQTMIQVPIILDKPDTDSTKISFQLQSNIQDLKSANNYYLYYGNLFADKYLASTIKSSSNVITKDIFLSKEIFHNVAASVNRTWILKNPTATKLMDGLTFQINLNNTAISSNSIVSYTIEGTKITGEMKKVNDKVYSASPDVLSLANGKYTIEAKIVDLNNNLKIISTYKVPFYVSYPLYVVWSIDWEGWDVNNYDLFEMTGIADKYGIPFTHMFNPRIYLDPAKQKPNNSAIPIISPQRANYLTSLVKTRSQTKGDEIDFHMHMFADMVAEAGVTPRPGTAGGAMYGDTITSNYTQSELEKIFQWGLDQFKAHGLPTPMAYRTGGWFSAPHVLKAAQDVGFLIDTTGRTPGRINPAIPSSTLLPWNLADTTRPYLPSVNDINSWSGNRLSIWEFPNNGADSYWFSAQDLIKRFQDNYNDPMINSQVLTYLSHPHWFKYRDAPKLRQLFDYIGQYQYKNDGGPVIYSTLGKIYGEWDKSQMNGK